jgi:hypothetical protein
MNTIFYPWSVPYHNRYGTAQLILPARKNSLFFLRHYLQRFHLKFLSLFVAALFFVASSATGQGPCPSSNCTSGDIRITKVELIKADGTALPNFCTPGVDLQVKLRVTFEVTSKTRYGFLVVANILINGNSIGTIAHCNPGTFAKGLHTMDVNTLSNGNPIIWPCGSAIQLKDVYTAWDQQVATASHPGICTYLTSNGTITDCATINPKCKFYGANEPILIVAPLIANFTAQEGSCNGLKRSWTFTSTTTGGTPPYTYTWNFGDGTAPLVTTQNPVTHDYAYSVTGNVNVTLSVKDASTPTNKTSLAQPQTISVTSCCTASTVPTGASAASPSICSGGSTSVSVIGGSLGTGASWKWYIGGCANGASIGTGSSINVNPTTTTTYYVRAEGDCGTTACASVTVTVKTPSSNPTSASAISPILCLGQSTDLSVTGGSLGTNASWKWYAGGCASGPSIGTGPSITVTPSATTTYYVRAEGDCNNTSCASVVVTVKTLSSAPSGASAASPSICIGGNTNLSVVGGSLGTGASWKWYKDGCASGASIGTGAMISVNPTQTTTYFVRAEGDCNNTACASVQVSVNPASFGGTLASDRTICAGSNVGLLSLTGNIGSIVRWEYSGTNAVGSYSAIGSTAATLTVGALYQDMWFRVVVKNGACAEATSNAIKITLQWPIANDYIGSSQTICSGTTPAALDGYSPTGGDGTYSYQWQRRTTGSWSSIPGATGFGYAPGPITENTEFRRVVSTGGACSSKPSNIVMISISPESQVYPISKTNFCQTAPNTGKVKLMDSYPGVSYQLKKASDNSNVQLPKIGTGDALEWTGLAAGTYYVYGTGLAPTYCKSQTTNVTILMFDCTEFYTLSQGGYGNNGGSCLGSNAVNTIMALLGNTDLVIGSTNTVTIPATIEGATKLNQVLPGGSGANALPAGNCVITSGCFVSPTYLTSGGKINNGLLSQTIVMSLNSRWNNNALLLFPIRSGYLTTQEMNGCYPNTTPSENCDIVSIQINPNVVSYLGPNATVADLLQLANDVLGGTKTPGINGVPSYSDISGALNSLVVAFHDGRRFLNYYDTQQGCELLTGSAAIETTAANTATSIVAEKETENIMTVTAFPNPFTDNINFQIETKQSGQGTLEVYNITGQKIKTIFSGYLNAGKQRFSMNVPAGQSSVLFYVFRMGSQKISGKLLHKGGR